jgi:hypothetical protein
LPRFHGQPRHEGRRPGLTSSEREELVRLRKEIVCAPDRERRDTEEAAITAGVSAPSATGGSARLVGCARSALLPRPAVTSRSPARGDRDRAGSWFGGEGDRAPPRLVAADDLEGASPQRGHACGLFGLPGDGRPVAPRAPAGSVRSKRASLTTRSSAPTSRTACRVSSAGLTARRSTVPAFGSGVAVTGARIAGGQGHGAPEQIAWRLPLDFPDDETMRTPTRPSTSHASSKAVERSSASS